MSHSLTNYLRKKLKLGFYGQKQPGITPFQAHNFCTIARDGDREKPKPFSQLQFTQHNTAASQPALYWLKKRDVAGLSLMPLLPSTEVFFLPPFPSSHFIFLLHSCSCGYHTQDNSGATLRVPKIQLQRTHPNSLKQSNKKAEEGGEGGRI